MSLRSTMMLGAILALASCKEHKEQNLAPAASALEPAKPVVPDALTLQVDAPSSQVKFSMEAPVEKISGEVLGAATGTLFVNLRDVTKTSGLVKVDLDQLVLYQEKRDDEKSAFSERTKNDLQNEHARTWLEISKDAPADVREANRFVEFSVKRIEAASASDVTTMTGAERKLTATIVGDFRLHGRKNEKRARVEVVFTFAGDKPESVKVRSLEPLAIGLEEYDVRPREAFGKLAAKTLSALGSKVAREARVELEFTAKP